MSEDPEMRRAAMVTRIPVSSRRLYFCVVVACQPG